MTLGGGEIAIGAGLLWLLTKYMGGGGTKGAPPPVGGKGGGAAIVKALPNQAVTSNPVTTFVAKNAGLVLGTGGTLLAAGAGTVATAAGVSVAVVAGYAAWAALVVIAVVEAVWRGVIDAQYVSDALRKGQAGLRADYVKLGAALAQANAQAMSGNPLANWWSLKFATAVVLGYNEVSRGGVDNIPWGTAWTGWAAHRQFWADRAMFLQDESGLEAEISSAAGMSGLFKGDIPPGELEKTQLWGKQLGRILWAWLFARKSMLEPWQYDWFYSGGGAAPSSGWSVGGWAPTAGANAMIGALYFVNQAIVAPPPLGWVNNYTADGTPINVTDVISVRELVVPSKTVAFPFVVDWTASDENNFVISSATDEQKPPVPFARFAGRQMLSTGQFAGLGGNYGTMGKFCVDPKTGAISLCPPAPIGTPAPVAPGVAPIDKSAFAPTTSRAPQSGGGGGLALPLALGAGAFLLFKTGALKAVGFGAYRPRRRRFRRRAR